MLTNDQALCSFECDALPQEKLLVASWQGEEGLSRPYRFEVVLATSNPLFDETTILGQKGCITLTDSQGVSHPYFGFFSQVEQLDSDDLYHYCRVVLEPRLARLRLHRFSEIWLDKNLPELLRDILGVANLTAEGSGPSGSDTSDYDFDLRLRDEDIAHTQANFTCQYEETSFAFLSRLLEYYGCYYFFEQQDDHEAVVICNDRNFQPAPMLPVLYRSLNSTLDAESQAVVRTFKRSTQVQPALVVLQDFSASNAQLSLRVTAPVAAEDDEPEASAAFGGYYGLYGQHFGSNVEGNWLAKLRAQALGCRHQLFHGQGRAVGLRAGGTLTLIGHPSPSMNGNYQVLKVTHRGQQPLPGGHDDQQSPEAETSFVALPGGIQFRPVLETPKPNVQGILSAVIDGDDTGKVLLNEHGCYKVSFPFIRSEKKATHGSAWLRMASLSTGPKHGMHFPLIKGSEVLISFLGGDPDRPIIIGSVPNSENPNKVNERNAMQSGLSTPGGHCFVMEDNPAVSHMKLGAPAGNTIFTLGQGEVSGANLRTDNHMQLTSSSYHHEVPGVYSMKILGGQPPSMSAPPVGDTPSSDANASGDATIPVPLKDLSVYDTTTAAGGNTFITGLPEGSTLSDGSHSITVGKDDANGINVTDWDLSHLTFLAPSNTTSTYTLFITATRANGSVTEGETTVSITKNKDSAPKITDIYNDKWGGPSWLNSGVSVKLFQNRTISVEIREAIEQLWVTMGALKEELIAQGASITTTLAGPKVVLECNTSVYKYHNMKKEVSPVKQAEIMVNKVQAAVDQLEAELVQVKSEIATITAGSSVKLEVVNTIDELNGKMSELSNVIELNEQGIQIAAAAGKSIQLIGPVIIQGAVTVTENLTTQAMLHANSANISTAITGNTATFSGELGAASATFGQPYVPPNVAELNAVIADALSDIAIFESVKSLVSTSAEAMNEIATTSLIAVDSVGVE